MDHRPACASLAWFRTIATSRAFTSTQQAIHELKVIDNFTALAVALKATNAKDPHLESAVGSTISAAQQLHIVAVAA
jgi:hypothetical protein